MLKVSLKLHASSLKLSTAACAHPHGRSPHKANLKIEILNLREALKLKRKTLSIRQGRDLMLKVSLNLYTYSLNLYTSACAHPHGLRPYKANLKIEILNLREALKLKRKTLSIRQGRD